MKATPAITRNLRVFCGSANPPLTNRICQEIGIEPGRIKVSRFSDGEIQVQIEESARGADVFLVQPTCAPVNDSIMELLIMLDAFRRASARRVTVVLPYYGYGRQDKKIKPREPITARLVANLIQQTGASRILCVDLHAGQIQGFFDIPVDHLMALPIIEHYLTEHGLANGDTCVVSPDVGGVARARTLAEMLGASIAIITKRRPEPNRAEAMEIIGDVEGKRCVLIDDMVDTGGSIVAGAEAVMGRGARSVIACCTHGILSGRAVERIEASPLQEMVITDTIPLPEPKRIDKIKTLSVAPLLADAIIRIHQNDSVSQLFQKYW